MGKAPKDEGVQTLRRSGQQGRHRHGEERGNDDFLASDGFGNHAGDGRHERHGQRDSAHRQADLDFRGMEKVLEKRQQRLRAIHVQKRASTRNHRSKDGRLE